MGMWTGLGWLRIKVGGGMLCEVRVVVFLLYQV